MISSLKNIFLFILTAGVTSAFAQTDSTDDVILKAMKDEMKRNMEELSYKEYERPFFISYTITDRQALSVNATLGGLVRSSFTPVRTKSVRVMVGDYSFNDESLDNRSHYGSYDNNEIEMPMGNDYHGIRRSLWGTTDAVYKSAAQLYKENQRYVKEQKKPLEEIPHRRFAKAPVVELMIDGASSQMDKESMEKYVKAVSAVFKDYSEIVNSYVTMYANIGHYYFVNSEGTVIKAPTSISSLQIEAQTKTDNGEVLRDDFTLYASLPEKLPALETAIAEAKRVAENLVRLRTTQPFKDSYTGPVLFMGSAVPEIVSACFFSSYRDESLIASNTINKEEMESSSAKFKIDKKVTAEEMTIRALPKLQNFQGTELLGATPADGEGVVPPDEIILIENGVLKNLLHDRSITADDQTSNGHSSGPAVIDVSYTFKDSQQALQQKLIETAKEEDLEYAIIIKSGRRTNYGKVDIYRVSLEDGKEEFVRSAQLKMPSMKSFRKVLGASEKQVAHNKSGNEGTSSFIVPEAILLEECEIEGSNSPSSLKDDFVVENPVGKSN